jgi:hypothetical protein
VYGCASEEVLYFRQHGFKPIVVPGMSSALVGPTFAGLPVTQKGAAESFIACTGVGRKGKEVNLPGYERWRTLNLLMGVARLPTIIDALTKSDPGEAGRRQGPAYPLNLPIAIIERASMPDQRVVVSMLEHIVAAFESASEQRPPGMIVIGWAVPALDKTGNCDVLEEGAEARDKEVIRRWLGENGSRWKIIEGLGDAAMTDAWAGLAAGISSRISPSIDPSHSLFYHLWLRASCTSSALCKTHAPSSPPEVYRKRLQQNVIKAASQCPQRDSNPRLPAVTDIIVLHDTDIDRTTSPLVNVGS